MYAIPREQDEILEDFFEKNIKSYEGLIKTTRKFKHEDKIPPVLRNLKTTLQVVQFF